MPQHTASSTRLNGTARAAALSYLGQVETELDVLVIGGGITGAGVALDAVTRGLNTALLEAADWASGTSGVSSKLVHGGIRYLEQLNFRLVREALHERTLLLRRIAPHLVRPVKFLAPLSTPVLERAYVGAGMMLYDLFARIGASSPGLPWHRHHTRRGLRRMAPGLRADALRGAISYSDAQVDDARYVTTLVRTAAGYGAHVASQTRVESFIREGNRVVGVIARDELTGTVVRIRAKHVIAATGVWSNELHDTLNVARSVQVRASQGVHVVVARDRIALTQGLLLRTSTSVLFVIPWGEFWLIGTTDTDWHGSVGHPQAQRSDIEYLLSTVNTVLADPLTRDDIVSVYAGLRPLVSGEAAHTATLSREHRVTTPAPGVTLVVGGKLTTYRVMAADAVDVAVAAIPKASWRRRAVPSVTRFTPLHGAPGVQAAWNQRAAFTEEFGCSPAHTTRLLRQHGAALAEVTELLRERPELRLPLRSDPRVLAVEIVFAATHEGALHLDDVLVRRTRLAIERSDRGIGVAAEAAALLSGVLGWDEETRAREISAYRTAVATARVAETE